MTPSGHAPTRVLSLASVVGGFLVWELAGRYLVGKSLFLAVPSQILWAGGELWSAGILQRHIVVSFSEFLLGYWLAVLIGITFGLLLAVSWRARAVLSPWVDGLYATPVIAVAPLIILWFGVGVMAKVVTAFTLVYFILLVNTLGGAKNVDNDIMTIAQLMGASKRDLLWKITLPSALPWIFAALSIALTYSLLGVIVAEILASNQGLGYLIASSAGNFDTAGVFAALVVLAAIAWAFSTAMRKAEGWLLRWKPSVGSA